MHCIAQQIIYSVTKHMQLKTHKTSRFGGPANLLKSMSAEFDQKVKTNHLSSTVMRVTNKKNHYYYLNKVC